MDTRRSPIAPRAGQITVLATSGTAASVDLRTCGQQAPLDTTTPNTNVPGLRGRYARVWAVGVDVYVAFGPSAASVASLNPAATGVNAAYACVPIFAGTYEEFLLADDVSLAGTTSAAPDTYLGYVTATGAGTIRIAQITR